MIRLRRAAYDLQDNAGTERFARKSSQRERRNFVPTVKLRIVAQPAEPNEFGQQVDLIRSSGARFDGSSKTWWLILAPETTSPDVLNPLFQAAMEYHTLVEAT